MRSPRFSIATIIFAVALSAINFEAIRTHLDGIVSAYDSPDADNPHWSSRFAFYLPVLDVLFVAGFRLRIPERRTRGAVAFLIVGSVATAVDFTVRRSAPEICDSLIGSISEPIVSAFMTGMAILMGEMEARTSYSVLQAVLILAGFLVPSLVVSSPAILAAWIGRRVVGRKPRPRKDNEDLA